MKKTVKLLIIATLVCLSLSIFIACGNSEHEHVYSSNIVKPTCGADGYTRYTCECGYFYDDNYTNSLEHNYQEEIINVATCSQKGEKRFTCSCGETYTDEFTLQTYSGTEIYDNVKNSIGEIVTYDKSGNELSLGTCFAYKIQGRFVTNYHVIEEAYSAKIAINNGTYSVKKVLAYDKDKDLAVLSIDTTSISLPRVCDKVHKVGEVVYAIGSSQGLTSTFSQGIITTAERTLDGVNYVQHDAAISSGNSGGPLVNSYGEIIGINTMTIRDSQNLNFAIAIKELRSLNYSNSLTMSDFYEKENNTFKKLKNYIIANGTYDSEDKEYDVSFATSTWNSTHKYQTGAYYDVEDNKITLTCYVYKRDFSYNIMSFLDITETGAYSWSIMDDNYNYMSGSIYPSSFKSTTLLTYSYVLGFNGSTYTARNVASSMIYQTLSDMKYDYSSIGVTAEDLGFIYVS